MPSRQFFLNRRNIDTLIIDIDSPPAGVGIVENHISIPKEYQNNRQSFDIGAYITYPDGNGERLRFKSRLAIPSEKNEFNGYTDHSLVYFSFAGTINSIFQCARHYNNFA